MSSICLIVVACAVKRTLLCERLVFHVPRGCNSSYVLLVASANGDLPCFRSRGCGLGAWRAFLVVRLPAVGDRVDRNFCVSVMIRMVGALVSNCTGMC